MGTMTYTGTLQVTTCWCGIPHAIPADLYAEMKRHGKKAYCPLGHTYVFSNTTEDKLARAEQRAKYANQRAEAERDLRLAEERSHSATKGHLTRAKKRHRAGLCPCCNRQFQDLVRHMASKHPEEAAKR